MGMQCQYQIAKEDGVTIQLNEGCEDSYTLTLASGAIISGYSTDRINFWFDCASCSDWQISNIRKLIINRICFTCC